ncbi:strongylocin 2-like [Lytechinus pictus]|uniref:strongylocin 2-like n=1 Tax=Lytechinus pictus TaxID=7653 RepID=UPI0030BA0CA6
MYIRKASFILLITLVILSQTMASQLFDELADDDSNAREESWGALTKLRKKVAHRTCEQTKKCQTTGGHETCADYICCHIVVFGKNTTPSCTAVTSS